MKLIVGLGNVGRKYHGTRHNVGFDVLAELTARFAFDTPRAQFEGATTQGRLGTDKVMLLEPHTLMNLSGASVLAARDFYKLENDAILIVCDDLNLPLGRIRLRAQGSAGGQKGLRNVIQRLGTEQIPRLRVGIGSPPPGWETPDYVLGKFREDERDSVKTAIGKAADAAECWATAGIAAAMNQFNGD